MEVEGTRRAIFNPPAALLEPLQAAWEEDGEDAGDTGEKRAFAVIGGSLGVREKGGVSAAAAVSRPPAGLRRNRRTRIKMNENAAVH